MRLVQAQPAVNQAWTTFDRELTANEVHAVLVSEDGSVWIGTAAGLDHFDGTWTSYTQEDGLGAGAVSALVEDADGTLWVGSVRGLAHSSEGSHGLTWAREITPAGFEPIHDLLIDRSGAVWIGTEGGAAYLDEKGWQLVDLGSDGEQTGRVLAMAEGTDGRIWLGGEGLHYVDPGAGQAISLPDLPTSDEIQSLLISPSNESWPETLWVGTKDDGLWSYDGHWVHFWRPPGTEPVEGLPNNDVRELAMDEVGTLWIATNGGGLSLFNRDGLGGLWGGSTWRTWTTFDGLAADSLAALDLDDHGVAWIGTALGLNRFDHRTWRTLSTPELPAGMNVTTILADSSGGIWIGTQQYGIVYFDGRDVHVISQESHGLPENDIRALIEDASGNIWVGMAQSGVAVAQLVGKTNLQNLGPRDWVRFDHRQLGSNMVGGAQQTQDGNLWFSTSTGLARYSPGSDLQEGSWQTYDIASGTSGSRVSQGAILEDGRGQIWVGTATGVARLDPASGRWRIYRARDGLGEGAVTSLTRHAGSEAGKESIWASTLAGNISTYDQESDSWRPFGPVLPPVLALVATPEQTLWAGTTNGLHRFDTGTALQHSYGRNEGLVDNEIRSLATGLDGSLWLGTRLGIMRHEPTTYRPKVQITGVNGLTPASSTVQVLAGEPAVIEYAGSHLLVPATSLVYRVRMEDLDDQWQVINQTQSTYQLGAPGVLTFQVEAWDEALNRSAPATLVLEVLPAMFLPLLGRVWAPSAYAFVGLLVIAAGGLGGLIVLQSRQRQRRQQAVKRRFNPYISGEPVRTSSMFFGRNRVLSRIGNTLHENSILIHGERRIGKTSLLHHLSRQLRRIEDADYLFVPVFVDLEGTPEPELFRVLMDEILSVTRGYLSELPETSLLAQPDAPYGDREFSKDLDVILGSLSGTTHKTVKLILLLDEMDTMSRYSPTTQQQFRRIFMRTFTRNLGAIIAGTQISKAWDRVESPWYNLFNEIELGPLDQRAARNLITEPVRGIYQFEPAAIEHIVAIAQGRPFLIQQHCLEAVNHMLAEGRNRITLADARAAAEIISSGQPQAPPLGLPLK